MKVTIDIDCTPEEARRFIGLPDLAPLHETYLGKIRSFMEEGVSRDALDQLVRGWAPLGEAGLAVWQRLFEQIGKPPA